MWLGEMISGGNKRVKGRGEGLGEGGERYGVFLLVHDIVVHLHAEDPTLV